MSTHYEKNEGLCVVINNSYYYHSSLETRDKCNRVLFKDFQSRDNLTENRI